MRRIRLWALSTAILGLASLASFILARLALTDIFHEEPDLRLEWQIVGLSFVPIIAFHLLALIGAFATLRFLSSMDREVHLSNHPPLEHGG